MTTIKLRYVEQYRDRHGRLRRYFRRQGFRRVPLRGEPGSAEFAADYQAAWDLTEQPSTPLRREVGEGRTRPGSMNALAVAYFGSSAFTGLARSTQGTYRGIIDHLRAEHGDDSVAGLQARHVRAIVERKAASGTPHAANNLLKVLRALMRHAVEIGWRAEDPTLGVRNVKAKVKGFHSWTDEEIAAYEMRWPVGTRARLALGLLLYTGQRRSDVVRMGRQHIRGGAIEVVQQKTGVDLSIPLHPNLQEILDRAPKEHLTILTTQAGKPFSVAGFGNWFRDCCTEAGLTHCSAHGLRKAAARRLAEAGCTAHMIQSITGHKTLKEVERYTAAAEQKRLARAAMTTLVEQSDHPTDCRVAGETRKRNKTA